MTDMGRVRPGCTWWPGSFAALADPARLRLLSMIAAQPGGECERPSNARVHPPYHLADCHRVVPCDDSKVQPMLLVKTEIESGPRWGELTELRVRDLDVGSRLLAVSRAVVEVHPRFHPDGGRFLVKEYPNDREYRRFKLSEQIATKLRAHIIERGLGPDDLLFRARSEEGPRLLKLRLVADPASLGRTEPNAAGRRYRHGTITGYSLGRCHCVYCRDAYARYRAARRAAGKDDPRGQRSLDSDSHIPRN